MRAMDAIDGNLSLAVRRSLAAAAQAVCARLPAAARRRPPPAAIQQPPLMLPAAGLRCSAVVR